MCDEPIEPRQLTEHDREVTLAKLRELFGGPPPDDLLALAEQRWDNPGGTIEEGGTEPED